MIADIVLQQITADVDKEIRRLQDIKTGAELFARLLNDYEEKRNKQHSEPSRQEGGEAPPHPSDQTP